MRVEIDPTLEIDDETAQALKENRLPEGRPSRRPTAAHPGDGRSSAERTACPPFNPPPPDARSRRSGHRRWWFGGRSSPGNLYAGFSSVRTGGVKRVGLSRAIHWLGLLLALPFHVVGWVLMTFSYILRRLR